MGNPNRGTPVRAIVRRINGQRSPQGSTAAVDKLGEALSKPGTHDAALAQLTRMQGREVVFHTALAVIGPGGEEQVDDVPTAVPT